MDWANFCLRLMIIYSVESFEFDRLADGAIFLVSLASSCRFYLFLLDSVRVRFCF